MQHLPRPPCFESVQIYLAGSALVCKAVQSVSSFFTLSPLAWLVTLIGKYFYLPESLTHTPDKIQLKIIITKKKKKKLESESLSPRPSLSHELVSGISGEHRRYFIYESVKPFFAFRWLEICPRFSSYFYDSAQMLLLYFVIIHL